MGISRLLGPLLGSLIDAAIHCKKFNKAIDDIHTMEFYQKSGPFRPTILFVSFNINELCTTFYHQQAMVALETFLNDYTSDHLINV
jgi:hypothetical protein